MARRVRTIADHRKRWEVDLPYREGLRAEVDAELKRSNFKGVFRLEMMHLYDGDPHSGYTKPFLVVTTTNEQLAAYVMMMYK